MIILCKVSQDAGLRRLYNREMTNDTQINRSNGFSDFPTKDIIGLMAYGWACFGRCGLYFFFLNHERNKPFLVLVLESKDLLVHSLLMLLLFIALIIFI